MKTLRLFCAVLALLFAQHLSNAQGQALTITTNATLPQAVIGEAINPPIQLEATGGTKPYTWSLVTGSPSLFGKIALGLNVTSSGQIVGTPTALQGLVGFTVQVTDSSSPKKITAPKKLSIKVVSATPKISSASMAPATIGVEYAWTFKATDGKLPYTWSNSTALPAGLSLNSTTGNLSGTISSSQSPGNFTLSITVSGSNGKSASGNFVLRINPAPVMSVSGPATISGQQNKAISPATYSVAGGVPPFSWSTIPALPAALSINATTGVISGNLTEAVGNYTVAVTVKDNGNRTATTTCNVTIASPPAALAILGPDELTTTQYQSIPVNSFTATGGTPPYKWSYQNLTSTLRINPPTGNVTSVIGNATAPPGNYTATITVRDGNGTGASTSRNCTIKILPVPPLSWTTSSLLPDGVRGKNYGPVPLNAAGGWGNLTFSGTAVPDLKITGSKLGWFPKTAGINQTFTLTVKDSNSPQASANKTFSLSVYEPLQILGTVELGNRTRSLGNFTLGNSLNRTITFNATGGKPPYKWKVETQGNPSSHIGKLPGNLTINPDGVLQGVPREAGSFAFNVKVEDSANPAQVVTTFQASANNPLRFLINIVKNTPTPSPKNLRFAIIGEPYSETLSSNSGADPITWSSNSTLPQGLELLSNGTISGTPEDDGGIYERTFPLRITATGSNDESGSGNYTLTVVRRLSISGNKTISGYENTRYPGNDTFSAQGGLKPYTFSWNATSGNMTVQALTGLSLNRTTGNVTGNFSGNGTYFVTARVDDKSTQNATMSTTIRILKRPTLSIVTPSNLGIVDTTVTNSLRLRANPRNPVGGGNYTWSRIGNITVMPAAAANSVTINVTSSGQLTYRSAVKCSANFTVQVRDGLSSATKNLTVSFRNPYDLYINTRSLPLGFVGYSYAQTLWSKNGKEPIKWSVVQGSLVPEFELVPDATGRSAVIRWKSAQPPSQPISKNFTLRVEDASPIKQVDECSYSLNIINIPPPPPPSPPGPKAKLFDSFGSVLPVGKILSVEDWNGDGLNDVFLRQTNPDTKEDQTALYTNRGGFVFQNDPALPIECRSAVHLLVEDFDNDSFPDILAIDRQLRATLCLNSGDGRFLVNELPGLLSGDLSGIDPEKDLSCADIDGDGDLDLLAAVRNPSGGNIVAIFNRADDEGTFPAVFSGKSYLVKSGTPYPKFSIVSVDENPKPDLLVLQATENSAANVSARLYLNTGNSSANYTNSNNATSCTGFITANASGILGSADGSFASVDIDNDGDMDLVASASLSDGSATLDAPRIFLNQGNATFTAYSAPVLDNALQHRALAAFDADLDGAIDIVWMDVSGVGPFYPRLWKNTWASNASFTDVTTNSDIGLSSSAASTIEMESTGFTADLDGDGDPDMLYTAVSRDGTQEGDPRFFAIYRNNSESRGETWLNSQLIGLFSPSRGSAARMVVQRDADVVDGNGTILTSKPKFAQIIGPDTGNKAKNNLIFGLGRKASADRVSVSWPSGLTTNLANVETNPFRNLPYYRLLRIPETDALPPQRPVRQGRVVPWGAEPVGSQTSFTANLTDSVAISAGGNHSLSLSASGIVKAWGSNSSGQLAVPANLAGIVQIAAGGRHNLALRSNGRLVAWGANDLGQATIPPTLRMAKTCAAGENFSLAVNALGQVVGWGDNSSGQCTPPLNLGSVQAVAAGQSHALALTANGSLVAWGSNSSGQLAVTSTNGTRFTQIAAGTNHSLALTSNGSVIAWGANNVGQSTVPAAALQNISQISASGDQSIALCADGTIITWGAGYQNSHLKPVSSNVVAISAGPTHALALSAVSSSYDDPNMVFVKGGLFPQNSDDREYLFQGIKVNDFRISKYEATRQNWLGVARWGIYNGYRFFTEGAGGQGNYNHPAYDLSWFDAVAWCNAMSEMNGLVPAYRLNGSVFKGNGATDPSEIQSLPNATGFRLPTEQQWEWAARGGNRSQNFEFSGGNTLSDVAINYANSQNASPSLESEGARGAFPIGTKTANELGLFDMSGNVWEHCFSFGINPEELQPYGNATTNSTISRGGSWINSDVSCGFSDQSQNFQSAGYTSNTIGFRLSLNAEPEIIIPQNALQPQPTGTGVAFEFTVVDPNNSTQSPWNAYRWTVEGNLPPGLTHSGFLNGNRLVLSGTPTKAGWYDIILQVETDGYLVRKPVTLKFTPTGTEFSDMVTVQGGTLPERSELAGQTVATFQIGKYEVSWDEWQTVRTWAVANGYTDLAGVGQGSAGNHPVRHVNWYDVVKWCNAKSQKEGLTPVYQVSGAIYKTGQSEPTVNTATNGYRLPLEKEWEWAALGGVNSKGFNYSGSNDINAVAWHASNSGSDTKAVGSKAANELMIFDMSGNVAEWCWGTVKPRTSPRGGGCLDTPIGNFIPGSLNPEVRAWQFGFRLARNLDTE